MSLARWACIALLALAGCALPLAPPAPAPLLAPHLRLIGVAELAHGSEYAGARIGGLSGIDYDAHSGEYLLISDASARIYRARLHYDAQRLDMPQFTATQDLLHTSGQPFAPWWRRQAGMDRPDAEGLRWLPGKTSFLWSSEGDFSRGFGPQLRESRLDGRPVRDIALPASFSPGTQPRRGPRGNGTLEGLALTPDGRTAWLAMELPWHQDGPQATPDSGGAPVRITAMDIASGQPLRQIAYQGDAVPQRRRLPGPQINGVSEILAHGPHHLLVLERSYSAGAGFGARLYRIDTRAGSDTLTLDALTPANHRPVPKTLVADLAALGLTPDNIEGMTWGPPVQGRCVLVFVSDDNFNPAQVTQFIAAQYLGPDGDGGQCGTTGASVLSTYP
ncbi:MAG: esterase-like activity of phytase family protein [Alicycliphilus sp.]|nr:esterase-like activity of phytase family protein [Alicycliphilus sp.]MCA0439352.1 esterase-like activity of phytase family protein [Pseudomonadota bacterium]MBP7325555.1 esterase-like activity of phytase family protein [Alicycliphilus sp.]MBP7328776.1 esterase-like activity of phytase family protein [Alicycliphilus sp.]MBP8138572.1 esterase-like activity of phytase family protein [Alicycliphilus sp.]